MLETHLNVQRPMMDPITKYNDVCVCVCVCVTQLCLTLQPYDL